MKKENHMINSEDAERGFEKTKNSCIIKNSQQPRNRMELPQINESMRNQQLMSYLSVHNCMLPPYNWREDKKIFFFPFRSTLYQSSLALH